MKKTIKNMEINVLELKGKIFTEININSDNNEIIFKCQIGESNGYYSESVSLKKIK